jgi:hypothetical protein
LALAWPRFLAAFRYLPVDIALDRYYADREIPTDRLLVLIDFARDAIERHDHYRFHDGLGQLHFLRGLDPHTPALERRPAYAEAEAEAVRSLQQAPAQPETWLRLATIRWILHDEPESIISPWKMSVFTGRTHSALYAQRVELGLAQRAFLDEEGLTLLRDQLLLAWNTHPGTLIQVLARRDRGLEVTRGLLEIHDPPRCGMEAWLKSFVKRWLGDAGAGGADSAPRSRPRCTRPARVRHRRYPRPSTCCASCTAGSRTTHRLRR